MTFTVTGGAGGLTGMSFLDLFPAGMTVANPMNDVSSCPGAVISAFPGGTDLEMSGGSVAASGTCTVQIDVTSSTIGANVNTSLPLVHDLGTLPVASATLTVDAPTVTLSLDFDDMDELGGIVTLTATLSAASASTITVTPGYSGTATDGVDFSQFGPFDILPGDLFASTFVESVDDAFIEGPETIVIDITGVSAGATENGVQQVSVVIIDDEAPPPNFTKSFTTDPVVAGTTTTLLFTIDNAASPLAASSLDFSDTFPGGIVVATTPAASTTCTGGTLTAIAGAGLVNYTGGTVAALSSCTVQVNVKAPTPGTHANTTSYLTSTLGKSAHATDNLTVTPNTPPVITSNGGGANAFVNAAENQTVVTTVTATDADVPAQTLTFSISGGADRTLFGIVAGVLTFNAARDFENPGDVGTDNVYDVQVTVTDDGTGRLTDVQDIAVTVTNVNEKPTITSDPTASASENQQFVIDLSSIDPEQAEGNGLLYFKTGGVDYPLFAVDTATGEVTFVLPPDFEEPGDQGKDNQYQVEIEVRDGGFLADKHDLAVTVTNVDETPTIWTAAAVSVPENRTAVTDVQSIDPEGQTEGAGLTYTKTGGADAGLFTLVAATGVLTFTSAPNFEAPVDDGGDNVYNVQ
ncbi:MAG: hypothetical protein ACI84D_002619, partial [Thalassolituus oleivorans]